MSGPADSRREVVDRLPPSPPRREADERDLSGIQTIGGDRAPAATDELITRMSESMPILPRLLQSGSLAEQLAIIRESLAPERYEPVLMALTALQYFFHHRDNRMQDALAVARLGHALARMLPQDLAHTSRLELSRARHLADWSQALGDIYADLGEPSEALVYLHEAEEWYARDERERQQAGIIGRTTFDRLFLQRDPRSYLFDKLGNLYLELGDEERAADYLQRRDDLDRGRPTVDVRVGELIDYGQRAEAAGALDDALRAFHEALDIAVADHNVQISARNVVASCHRIGNLL
jgi:tetratricopeptide (TPR) repeat protein